MNISRLYGDESAIRITWELEGHVNMANVTAIKIRVYDQKNISGATLIEELDGELRGFDPATYFPVISGEWSGTRFYRVVIIRGTEEKVLKDVYEWTQI